MYVELADVVLVWCVSVGEGKGCNRPHHKSLSLSHMVSFTATTSTDVIELLARIGYKR